MTKGFSRKWADSFRGATSHTQPAGAFFLKQSVSYGKTASPALERELCCVFGSMDVYS